MSIVGNLKGRSNFSLLNIIYRFMIILGESFLTSSGGINGRNSKIRCFWASLSSKYERKQREKGTNRVVQKGFVGRNARFQNFAPILTRFSSRFLSFHVNNVYLGEKICDCEISTIFWTFVLKSRFFGSDMYKIIKIPVSSNKNGEYLHLIAKIITLAAIHY